MAQGSDSGIPLDGPARVELSCTPFRRLRARLPLAWRGGEPLYFVSLHCVSHHRATLRLVAYNMR